MKEKEVILSGITLKELLEQIKQIVSSAVENLKETQVLQNEPAFISRKDVCKMLKISPPTLNKWTKIGILLSYKGVGRRVLYKPYEVKKVMKLVVHNKHKRNISPFAG